MLRSTFYVNCYLCIARVPFVLSRFALESLFSLRDRWIVANLIIYRKTTSRLEALGKDQESLNAWQAVVFQLCVVELKSLVFFFKNKSAERTGNIKVSAQILSTKKIWRLARKLKSEFFISI